MEEKAKTVRPLRVLFVEHGAPPSSTWMRSIFAFVPHVAAADAGDCDVVVCNDLTTNSHSDNAALANAVLARADPRPAVLFIHDDPEAAMPPFPPRADGAQWSARNLRVFRTSLRRSLRAPHERLLPSLQCHDEGRAQLPPCALARGQRPRLAFVGCYFTSPERLQACTLFEHDARFEKDFRYRARFHMHFTPEEQARNRAEFDEGLLRSPYQLCARGAGNFSHRLFEVLASGRVPVLADSDSVAPENVPAAVWADTLVLAPRVADLPAALLAFHATRDVVAAQLACRALWERYLSPRALGEHVAAEIAQMLEQQPAARSPPPPPSAGSAIAAAAAAAAAAPAPHTSDAKTQ